MLLSELPLTQLLLKGDVAWNGNYNRDADPNVEILYMDLMRNKSSIESLYNKHLGGKSEITADAVYMFDKLNSNDICISNPQGGTKVSKLKYQTKPRLWKILHKHTRWFPLLKSQVKDSLLRFVSISEDGTLNLARFRRVLEAVDHIVTGFFLSGEEAAVINRIQISLISNLVTTGESGYYHYLKDYKTLVKRLRKSVLSGCPLPEVQPSFHWIKKTTFWYRINQVVSNPTTGWEELQHVMVVLQTRSTGLANGQWEKDSKVKWIKTTSNDESNYTVSFLYQGAESLESRVKDQGIISLTAASCVESTRKHGGKFSAIKDILLEIQRDGIELIDWDTGEFSEAKHYLPTNYKISEKWGEGIETFITPEIGHYLFSYALKQFREGYDVNRINLSTVVEQGKARIVTPNSLILYLLTMPLSHATLRCFEAIPELNVGVSKTNDAWEFWKRMKSSDFEEATQTYSHSFICADLETATDYSPFELVSSTLDIMKNLGVQGWYIEVVKKLLASPRWYMREKTNKQETAVHRTRRGALMADPGTKSVLSLSHYLIIESIKRSLNVDITYAIKGDDVVIQCPRDRTEEIFKMYTTRMKSSGFVLSEDDTYTSNVYAFYCEGMFRNYHLTSESPTSWNSLINTTNPSYCDIPTVKLAYPVYKNNYRIGETPEGKISLLSKRRGYFREGSFARFQYDILDLIQTLTFRLNEYDLQFLFGAKWKGCLSKPITALTKQLLPLTSEDKKQLSLDYLFIINKVYRNKTPKKFQLPSKVLDTIEERTNRFYLPNDIDDERTGEYKMIDFDINLPKVWDSKDEREWGLSLGPTLLSIRGISTDKSIKSKIVTLHNLTETPLRVETYVSQETIDNDLLVESYKQTIDVDDFEEIYSLYSRIRIEQYPFVQWSLHLESDFPLYNAMKVNPDDYQNDIIADEIRKYRQDFKDSYEGRSTDSLAKVGLTYKQQLAVRLATYLHGRKNKAGSAEDQAYLDAIESTTDFDQQAVLKLARIYGKISNFLRTIASSGLEPEEIRKGLREAVPHRFLIWFSNDKERFNLLEEMNLNYLNDLGVDDSLRWLFKVDLARYMPVGIMTDFGYMIEKYIRIEGYIPLVPSELTDDDLYEQFFEDTVGFDFDNIESLAQSVREGTQREVNGVQVQGSRTELGYFIVDEIPGLLVS